MSKVTTYFLKVIMQGVKKTYVMTVVSQDSPFPIWPVVNMRCEIQIFADNPQLYFYDTQADHPNLYARIIYHLV